jgi:hypothetical protein
MNDPRLLYPTAMEMSVTFMSVDSRSRLAWNMRTAARNLPGETPVAPPKLRQKWNLLNIALRAMSSSDSGSAYLSHMYAAARSTALSIDASGTES